MVRCPHSEKVRLFGKDQMHRNLLLPPAKMAPCHGPKPEHEDNLLALHVIQGSRTHDLE